MTTVDVLWTLLAFAVLMTWTLASTHARRRPHAAPYRPRHADLDTLLARHDTAEAVARALAATAAHDYAAAHRYEDMISAALLFPAAVATPAVPDPGNPGNPLRLLVDPHGAIAPQPGGRVLLAVDPAARALGKPSLVAIPVPPHLDDPLAAAAWTYDVPPDTYAALARRT
jgi:hypothetical protein